MLNFVFDSRDDFFYGTAIESIWRNYNSVVIYRPVRVVVLGFRLKYNLDVLEVWICVKKFLRQHVFCPNPSIRLGASQRLSISTFRLLGVQLSGRIDFLDHFLCQFHIDATANLVPPFAIPSDLPACHEEHFLLLFL